MPPAQIIGQGLLFGLTIGVMVIGLAGILLPMIPGLPIIWLAAAAYGLLDGFHSLDIWTFLFITALMGLGVGAHALGGHVGAHLGGASTLAGVAAIVLGLAGLLVTLFNPLGALVGALLGVFLAELLRFRALGRALRSSAAWLAGWLAGVGMQLAIGGIMIGVFALRVLIAR